jgi:hypothetical protein
MKTTRSKSQLRWQFAFRLIQPNVSRGGWTVLEVLISSGIMVVGLACVAALLPAAAQRMAQAVSEDRAGTVAANAYADIMARRPLGLLSAGTGDLLNGLASNQIAVFGCLADDDIKRDGSSGSDSITLKIDEASFGGANAWESHDALQYGEVSGSPTNSIVGSEREYRSGVCWLATVTCPAGAAPGNAADLSIAVFKKRPEEYRSYSPVNGFYNVPDDERRQFLKGCSYVLDVTPAQTPTWRLVTASWSNGSDTTLVLDPPPSSASPTLLGFEHLLRVEKHRVVLD